MLLTLLPEANAFQGINGAPEDWVQHIITSMVKKTTRQVTDGIMNTATSSLQGLVGSNCQKLFPCLALLIFTLYFFCLNGLMTILEFLMNLFSKPQNRGPDHEDAGTVEIFKEKSTTPSDLPSHPGSSNRVPISGQGSIGKQYNHDGQNEHQAYKYTSSHPPNLSYIFPFLSRGIPRCTSRKNG